MPQDLFRNRCCQKCFIVYTASVTKQFEEDSKRCPGTDLIMNF